MGTLAMHEVLRTKASGWSDIAGANVFDSNGVLINSSKRWPVADVSFFFQAEDGIRDVAVTGVQTCALPISRAARGQGAPGRLARPAGAHGRGLRPLAGGFGHRAESGRARRRAR